ncbi:AAA family ATPase [Sneathiella sp. HT1-7]|uniref:AAA family ATPase n=1 Tax=Sneathiella sp. HT1-7 TaxID=2887192 RepID=UPI001D13AFF3|nr:ATP-binding protein [Sneathiella sp. HT1-7]MCC3305843.1 ATP-binding protein [Sneathiella sp. HT1-7]
MIASKHLIALLRSHIDGDNEQFLSVAMQVAAHEARQGHGNLAQQLRDLVDEARSLKQSRSSRPVPFAQPKGDLAALISASYSETRLSSMVLPTALEQRLKRIITEQRQQHRLVEHGLHPRRKILLIGPPGSGKTMTAAALAGELTLPLFTVVFDSLITRFMGETASKLRLVFDAMLQTRGVYFFDEFDAIGARRAERNDVGEIRRVLNSFLQFLENDNSESLIIAATNHPELLDPALFRRFDDVIHYDLPNPSIASSILKARLSGFDTKGMQWKDVVKETSGLSQAEVSRAADEAAKRAILAERTKVTRDDLLGAIAERKASTER